MRSLLFCLLWSFFSVNAWSQVTLQGFVTDSSSHAPLPGTYLHLPALKKTVITNPAGHYQFKNIPAGEYRIIVFHTGKKRLESTLKIDSAHTRFSPELVDLMALTATVTVKAEKERTFGMSRLEAVGDYALHEAKKNEVVVLAEMPVVTSTNNSRQALGKVPGLNVWENDGAGLQIGIGARGLSPNRSSNFNMRQNGYEISADPLGYPESYYTPPFEALERIELVRGAGALQYGTQFGGLVNFVFKKGPEDKSLDWTFRQSFGSFGYMGIYNSLGGTVAKGKLNYFGFFQHKSGNGWRPNSRFNANTGYFALRLKPTRKLALNLEYTGMEYLAQQAGGLTDAMFEQDPRQSIRSRNWFEVKWNLLSVTGEYKISPRLRLQHRIFGLIAERNSLGNLERINVSDLPGNRTLIKGDFRNLTNETRVLYDFNIGKTSLTLLSGLRFFQGNTRAQQGDGSAAADPDFNFLNPNRLENSDYAYHNTNQALFSEAIWRPHPQLAVTAGLRWENINTTADGYYRTILKDFAGNIIVDTLFQDQRERKRQFFLAGAGFSWKSKNKGYEIYGNITQNYRAINFSDLRIVNPNFVIDPNIKDERGYSADLGWRGRSKNLLNYDVSLFLLQYKDRIGDVLRADRPPLYQDYRYRTNIAQSLAYGLEAFAELNISRLIKKRPTKLLVSVFQNLALVNARYINTPDKSINNKQVEQTPPIVYRGGINAWYGPWGFIAQFNYTGKHYTDATNAERTATAVNGAIPAYQILDLSLKLDKHWYGLTATCNNVLNAAYFTRRADAYPGPGIIPSDGRAFYLTLEIRPTALKLRSKN